MYQQRYWRELDQLKVHVTYLELYQESTIKIDRRINMFLAITSSGSIGGWVIWQHLSWLWAGIIACSQVCTAVKGYLPFSKRVKSLQGITNELESLFLLMESKWYDISEGKLTEEEIHLLHMKYKEQRRSIIQKHLGADPLPEKDKLLEKAKVLSKSYFTNFYSLTENSNVE
jgi:hypothetical protein